MPRPLISVIVPTIPGREDLLEACLWSFERHTPPEMLELVPVRDSPSCGAGWTLGAARSTGNYLLLAADDVEAHGGWWEGACRPFTCPVLLWPDGRVQGRGGHRQDVAHGGQPFNVAFPFLQRWLFERLEPIPPFNHHCDCWITEGAARLGFPGFVDHHCVLTHKVMGDYDENDAYAVWKREHGRD